MQGKVDTRSAMSDLGCHMSLQDMDDSVDTLVLRTNAERCESSNLFARHKQKVRVAART